MFSRIAAQYGAMHIRIEMEGIQQKDCAKFLKAKIEK
jgi:hypothetical protein